MEDKCVLKLKTGQTAMVKEIHGDNDGIRKLEALGVRPGKELTKIGSNFWKGPITVKVGSTKIAIGHTMARNIIVEHIDGKV